MKRNILNRGNEKPTPAMVWALRKSNGLEAVYERWSSKWSKKTLRLLGARGRLDEVMQQDEAEHGTRN
jgi:hypothetical protein